MNYEVAGAGSVSGIVAANKVLKNTYMLLSMTLIFSAVMASVSVAMAVPPMVAMGCSLVALVMVFLLPKFENSSAGIGFVFAFTGLLGFSLGPMLSYYLAVPGGGQMIAQALGGTGVVFLGLSGYALTTKRDFSFMRGFLVAGLITIIVAGIANIFLQMPILHVTISSVAALVFSGLILYDTQRIARGEETNYIRATVSLYLNIHNLFVHMLSLIGAFSGDD